MMSSKEAHVRSLGRSAERGTILLTCVIIVILVILASLAMFAYSTAIAERLYGGSRVERAAAVGETGLSFLVEQWRRTPAFLADSDTGTPGVQNANIGVVRQADAGGGQMGTFELLSIEDVAMAANTTGKMVRVRSEVNGMRYVWQALLSPNISSPIQGVATQEHQTWSGDSTFSGDGDLFAGGNINVIGNAQVNGDAAVTSGNTINTGGGGTITGTQTENMGAPSFPDQQAQVDQVVSDMANAPMSHWTDAKTAINVATAPTRMEIVRETSTNLDFNSSWASTRTLVNHLAIEGGNMTLEGGTGNFAFGRLWMNGGILTIRAPAGGADLVVHDLYLMNGARLILDTRDGPFRVLTPRNQTDSDNGSPGYPTSGSSAFTAGAKWAAGSTGTNGWSATAVTGPSGANPLEAKFDGTTSGFLWVRDACQGTSLPKPERGTTTGYDDWTIKDQAVLAVVTPNPGAEGVDVYFNNGGDLVLHNGARIMAGVQEANLAALQTPATTAAAIGAMGVNAPGFVAWSGGGDLPRFNIDADSNPVATSGSFFTGLTYGGFEGTIGDLGHFEGGFVGEFFECAGTVVYDSRLRALLARAAPDSHHVVVKFRVGG